MATENLREEVGEALMTFQFLEEAIREYLDIKVKIIKKNVKDLNKKFSLYEENDTLGTLIRKFEKVCDNDVLVKSLGKIPKERNKLAHHIWLNFRKQSDRLLYGDRDREIGEKLEKCVIEKINEVKEMGKEAHLCLFGLIGETVKIEGLLE